MTKKKKNKKNYAVESIVICILGIILNICLFSFSPILSIFLTALMASLLIASFVYNKNNKKALETIKVIRNFTVTIIIIEILIIFFIFFSFLNAFKGIG